MLVILNNLITDSQYRCYFTVYSYFISQISEDYRRMSDAIRLLNTALEMLKVEKQDKEKEREQVLSERVPPLHLSSLSVQELQTLLCIDVIDEERYDIAIKVSKNDKEIQEMNQKIYEMKSKLKRPNLKRVKLSSIDFKKEEVTDWRKNVEAMSGMEGRKKLFDAGQ
uniref:Uncharacterized protein n=1 Tax=Sinocyclocheilus grahami TaxID=75366 RepID=A0A672SED2_SINGR